MQRIFRVKVEVGRSIWEAGRAKFSRMCVKFFFRTTLDSSAKNKDVAGLGSGRLGLVRILSKATNGCPAT